MDTFVKLVKKHKLDRICHLGIWLIALLGAGQIGSSLYAAWQSYDQTTSSQFPGAPPANLLPSILLNYFPSLSANVCFYIFFCIVLYCASVVFKALGASVEENQVDAQSKEHDPGDERIVYTSLKPEEILQSKKLFDRK
jgi:hypothetical protein